MERLIDAELIKTVDYSGLAYIAPNDYRGIADYFYKQLITNQPTAYDVEKVVEQLESYDFNNKPVTAFGQELQKRCIDEAISIVKGGGQG